MRATAIQLVHPVAAEPTEPWGSVPSQPEEDVPPLADYPVPPATRAEARALRDGLARLITRERQAAADFLLALADFDRRRGWAALGHRSLFDFLKKELKCSSGAASHRSAAARLIPEFPAVEAALRAGDLCLSSLRHLARVLKPENEADYLPRFYGLSAREAEALAAELLPRAVQPRREVVTLLPQPKAVHTCEQKRPEEGLGPAEGRPAGGWASCSGGSSTNPVHTCELVLDLPRTTGAEGAAAPAGAVSRPVSPPATQVEPLSADLRRLHLTVSTRLLGKLDSAKAGLAHALPGATTEQVLEAALDLLLEKQARRRGATKPLRAMPAPAGRAQADQLGVEEARRQQAPASPPSPSKPAGTTAIVSTRYIPAAVRREVWARDGQRCQHPLDGGGTCGATHRPELDHLVPLALGGPSTAANLRVTCAVHNRAAAREILGEALVEDRRVRAKARVRREREGR